MAAVYLLLAALFFRSCSWAEEQKVQPPSFSSDSIVNSANGSSASLTPNGLATIFGSSLAEVTASALNVDQGLLPTTLGGVRIRIGGVFVSLLYVSPERVNFLIPCELIPGSAELSLAKQGLSRAARIELLDAAPALFSAEGRVAATHADGSSISMTAPARPGEIIVVYGTGLGPTDPPQQDGLIPGSAARIRLLDRLRVLLDGQPIPSESILYAGITPGSAGVYQINLQLPDKILTEEPELRVALGDQISQSALALRVAADTP
jgi:uncharacterized protein (TIGR03437 family)